ncbi:MAG: carboxypeptidase regulatory-like domain-containing protein [Myxococcales bacterium]|jgi:hypothetical protein
MASPLVRGRGGLPPVIALLLCAAGARAQDAAPAPTATESPGEPVAANASTFRRPLSGRDGSSGGLTVAHPGTGEVGSVRLQLVLDAFPEDDFLLEGQGLGQSRRALSLSFTPMRSLEVFANLQDQGTTGDPGATGVTSALHTQSVGLGFKYVHDLSDLLAVSGGVRISLRNEVGSQSPLLQATSIGLRAAIAADLREMPQRLPLLARFNLDYLFDNGAQAIESVEDARYDALDDARAPGAEVRHLITRQERYGLDVNRVDRMTTALGLEAPLPVGEDAAIHPLLEWRLGVPVNRQGYDCPLRSSEPNVGEASNPADSCLGEAGAGAWPMHLLLGARVLPPLRGASATLALDLALSGDSTFVRELAPSSPFSLILALGYDYDARPVEPVIVEAPAPPRPAAPPRGRLQGTVIDARSGGTVAGATVRVAGSPLGPLASAADGSFTTYALEPGQVSLELSHPHYAPGTCTGAIPPEGGETSVRCSLTPLPVHSRLIGRVRDPYGRAIEGANLQLDGPSATRVQSGADGRLEVAELPPGNYRVRVEAEGYLARVETISLGAREARSLQVVLVPRPERPSVIRRGDRIRTPGLRFASDSDALSPDSALAVAELVDLLLREPKIEGIRVQGPEPRAQALKQALVEGGVAAGRIELADGPAKRLMITIPD